MVGFECTNWMRTKRKNKTGFATLKLDMNKAYDKSGIELSSCCYDEIGIRREMGRINYAMCYFGQALSSFEF